MALGQPALSLLDVIPVTGHGTTEFAYMRQTVRTNNAAVVAEGAVKPTSVYTVNKIPNSLVVIAHLFEAIPRFWLIDQVSLETFVSSELEFGLRLAVEAKVLADVNATSGIQTQAYATSVLTVLRKSITKLETAGYTPGSLVVHPTTGKVWNWRCHRSARWNTCRCPTTPHYGTQPIKSPAVQRTAGPPPRA